MESIDFDIRYTEESDEQYLRTWLTVPGVLYWFPMQEGKELDGAVQCWIGFAKWKSSLTVIVDGIPVAIGTLFLMPYRKVAHQALIKIIVDPQRRDLGFGTNLLRNLKHLAKSYFGLKLVYLEILEDNPIASILEKEGFKEFMRQEKFFKEGSRYHSRICWEALL